MPQTYTGNCHCKSSTYNYQGEPLTSYACHCTDCQAASGAAFSLNMIVRMADLEHISGELQTYTYPHNDQVLTSSCCKTCGVALWLTFSDDPEWGTLLTGTLHHQGQFNPVAHIWMRSAVSWIQPDPDVSRFDTQPEMGDLTRLWDQRPHA